MEKGTGLQGRVALVTGASRGIGLAVAKRLGRAGARIVVMDMAFREGPEAVIEALKGVGAEARTHEVNVTDSGQVEALFKTVEEEWGGVDILVNNAGITRDALLMRMTDEQWDAVLNVNLKGAFLCSRAAIRGMMRKRWGRIVSLSSVVALGGEPGIYSARWAETPEGRDFRHAMQTVWRKLEAIAAPEPRRAAFVCALTLAWPDGHDETFLGTCAGQLVWPPRGDRGFGYDPVFMPEGHAITFGEMEPESKHTISHRADAFRQLVTACFGACIEG